MLAYSELGSGKATITLSQFGHTRPGTPAGGRVHPVGKSRLTEIDDAGLRAIPVSRIAYVARRVAALAPITGPELLIPDEPTTALDVTATAFARDGVQYMSATSR